MATTTSATPGPRRAGGGELTEQQKDAYWRYNVTLTTTLLIIWFVVTFVISGVLAGALNNITILGFPLEYGIREEG
jgi:uncharacterized membrane protein